MIHHLRKATVRMKHLLSEQMTHPFIVNMIRAECLKLLMSTNTLEKRDEITGRSAHLAVVIVGQREQGDWASWRAAVAHGRHVSIAHDGHRAQGLAWVRMGDRVGLASKFAAQS